MQGQVISRLYTASYGFIDAVAFWFLRAQVSPGTLSDAGGPAAFAPEQVGTWDSVSSSFFFHVPVTCGYTHLRIRF